MSTTYPIYYVVDNKHMITITDEKKHQRMRDIISQGPDVNWEVADKTHAVVAAWLERTAK